MITARSTIARLLLFTAVVLSPALYAAEASRDLDWQDLMPTGFSDEALFADYDVSAFLDGDPEGMKRFEAFKQRLQSAPVVAELNGELISLPGFALPLEGDGEITREFLLVPYFGACIHVPPPPSNQIVLVRAEPGVVIESLFAPVKVSGRMLIEAVSTELAEAGYTLLLTAIEELEPIQEP